MTQNQATLFFLAEYGVTAIILFLCSMRHTFLDVKKTISRKAFLKRLPFVFLIAVIGIGGMAGAYVARLQGESFIVTVGACQLIMTACINTLLFGSWIQRYRIYPRGKELVTVVILMYVVADLFMPSGIKYAVLMVGSALALGIPNAWR